MPLPITFGTLPSGNQPLTDFDLMFNAVAALGSIPCLCSGTNVLALTPYTGMPTISAYSDLTPQFIFTAAATNTGGVTISVGGMGAKTAVKSNGALVLVNGDLVAGRIYRAVYSASLDQFIVDVTDSLSLIASDVEMIIDGGGVAIVPALKGYVHVPYPISIVKWYVMADQVGSISIDVLGANSAVPSVSIVGTGNAPALSSQQLNSALATGWTTTVFPSDLWLGFNVLSASTVTRATVVLEATKL